MYSDAIRLFYSHLIKTLLLGGHFQEDRFKTFQVQLNELSEFICCILKIPTQG